MCVCDVVQSSLKVDQSIFKVNLSSLTCHSQVRKLAQGVSLYNEFVFSTCYNSTHYGRDPRQVSYI